MPETPSPPVPAAFPDTPLTRAADLLLTTHHPAWLVRHSRRTFRFGCAALDVLHPAAGSVDRELLLVAALLHDVALGGPLDDALSDFQQLGAGVARQLMLAQGSTDRDADLVFDAVALHLEPASARDPRPEVAAVALGAAMDVAGLRLERLDPALVETVLAAHPREGTTVALVQAITTQVNGKPRSRVALLEREVNLLAAIAAAPFPE
jgi:hypothetical protein